MWRKRMQDLSRLAGRPHVPLFAPVLFGVAAQVESISPEAMAADPTRLRKNVGELRRILGLDAVFCLAPGDAEMEAIGPVGSEVSSETVAKQRNIAASLEAVRQWRADASEPVVVVAVRGPASLSKGVRAKGGDAPAEAIFQHVGRGVAAIARAFAEAGADLLQLHEEALPAADALDLWKGALGTAGNVARFHKMAPILVVGDGAIDQWPAQAIACPTTAQQPPSRLHGRAWPADPAEWPSLPGEGAAERVVTTTAEVSRDVALEVLLVDVRRTRGET